MLNAFRLMADNDLSGIAVVDDDGKLVAATSAADVKQLLRDPTASLKLSVEEYMAKVCVPLDT